MFANKDVPKDRKRSVAKFTIKTVHNGRINNGTIIGHEIANASPVLWCDTVYDLDPNNIINISTMTYSKLNSFLILCII